VCVCVRVCVCACVYMRIVYVCVCVFVLRAREFAKVCLCGVCGVRSLTLPVKPCTMTRVFLSTKTLAVVAIPRCTRLAAWTTRAREEPNILRAGMACSQGPNAVVAVCDICGRGLKWSKEFLLI
jgi:hypothetical protein